MADETAALTKPPPKPIFFGITSSFIGGIVPALAVMVDWTIALSTSDAAGPVADFLAWLFGWEPASATTVVRGVGTFATFWVAYQRSGASRPWTVKTTKETMK